MSTWAEREARRIEKARTLIQSGIPGSGGIWADLGCGDGIFTAALHTLIQPHGEIYGVDNDRRALDVLTRNFAESFPDGVLFPTLADFTRALSLPSLEGALMANSLHFVRDKQPVLARIASLVRPGGRLIVVEYNTTRGNSAVPHPIDETGFLEIAETAGLSDPQILARVPSRFLGEMYAGMGTVAS